MTYNQSEALINRDQEVPVPELKFTPRVRKKLRIFFRDKFQCTYCTETFTEYEELTIDHVLPKAFGGGNGYDNLTTCCKGCNGDKGSLLLTEFIQRHNLEITEKINAYL